MGGKSFRVFVEDVDVDVAVVVVEEAVGRRATFLKVMVHLGSSPAKTTCSCQRTKTRMLLVLLWLVEVVWVVVVVVLKLLLGLSGGMVGNFQVG